MNELLESLLEEAKKDNVKLNALKVLAVKCSQFQLAQNIREIQQELFPDSEEAKLAKEKAAKLNLVFRMVELDIPNDVCWLLNATIKKYWKRRGNFDLLDASELVAKRKELFKLAE